MTFTTMALSGLGGWLIGNGIGSLIFWPRKSITPQVLKFLVGAILIYLA